MPMACMAMCAGVTASVPGLVTVTVVEAVLPAVAAAVDVAVTVHAPAVAGAVNRPVALIDPQEAFHVAVLEAENCSVAFTLTLGFSGEMENVVLPLPPVPLPVSAIVCGLLLAASVNCSVAARVPARVGAKRMVAVQLAEAARLAPHVLAEMRKSPGFAPEMAMLPMVIAVEPLLLRVTDFGPPLFPTATLFQLRVAGLTDALPPPVELLAVPRPESATVCGLPLAESVNLSEAVRVPAAVGAKTMVAVQEAEAATLAPQVLP